MSRPRWLAGVVVGTVVSVAGLQAGQGRGDIVTKVDRVFAGFSTASPGCAVGVGVDGAPVVLRGYGMADLEHDVPITADTIFEAGSVSKQFTAAAVLLLARDGKLSLDDMVRKYVPEVPDYGAAITIRQMLTHSSGLRDWGSVEGIAGWPRSTRANTHAHVLDVVSRQRSLNFTPGTHWSYTNTGYNLAAIIVSRVAGASLAEFTRTRIFEPLGMTRTSWRDDYARVVKNRAVAYEESKGIFRADMPFEDVHGNGGLLTTVGDLLKWNENAWSPSVGDATFISEPQRPVTFGGGEGTGYGLGLFVGQRRGLRQVEHGGTTAGYTAHLARYPDQHVSVAVLCNVGSAGPTQRAYQVADLYLAERATLAAPPTPSHVLKPDDLRNLEGVYRSLQNGRFIRLVPADDGLRVEGGGALIARSSTEFVTASGQQWALDGRGRAKVRDGLDTVDYERVPVARPSVQELAELVGRYVSTEAEVVLQVALEGESLVATRRPSVKIPLTPVYRDAFNAPALGLVIFRRDPSARVSELSVVQDRVWDLRFVRDSPGATR